MNTYDIHAQVLALTMDLSGARVVTGGYDYDVRLWEFAEMDSSLRSFRTIWPCERQVVRVTSKRSGCWTCSSRLGKCQKTVISG